jgi:hypothetical protein
MKQTLLLIYFALLGLSNKIKNVKLLILGIFRACVNDKPKNSYNN